MNGYPGDKETPLITAASYGDAEVAKVPIEAGADIEAVSAPDSGGVPSGTALTHAAVFGMTEVVDVLVAAGVRITSLGNAAAAGDIAGWPLARFTPQSKIQALVFAADHQRLTVIDPLVAAGTPVNEPEAEWGRLLLHIAAQDGRPASVRRLLAHGAASCRARGAVRRAPDSSTSGPFPLGPERTRRTIRSGIRHAQARQMVPVPMVEGLDWAAMPRLTSRWLLLAGK